MKCNKCSYTSFDHNQNCPKCNHDLVAEATKMNLPSYLSSPPYLLASLLGGTDEYVKIIPSQEPSDHLPEENSEKPTADTFELPQRTILPGLAEAVAELAKKEDEDGAIKGQRPQDQQKNTVSTPETSASSVENKVDSYAATRSETSRDAQDEEDDMFEFIFDDDEQTKEPALTAESRLGAAVQEIEITMLPEEDSDGQINPEKEISPDKKTAQGHSMDDLDHIELTMEKK